MESYVWQNCIQNLFPSQNNCWLDNLQVSTTVQKFFYIQNLFLDKKCMHLVYTYYTISQSLLS